MHAFSTTVLIYGMSSFSAISFTELFPLWALNDTAHHGLGFTVCYIHLVQYLAVVDPIHVIYLLPLAYIVYSGHSCCAIIRYHALYKYLSAICSLRIYYFLNILPVVQANRNCHGLLCSTSDSFSGTAINFLYFHRKYANIYVCLNSYIIFDTHRHTHTHTTFFLKPAPPSSSSHYYYFKNNCNSVFAPLHLPWDSLSYFRSSQSDWVTVEF